MITFAIVTDLFRTSKFSEFDHALPSTLIFLPCLICFLTESCLGTTFHVSIITWVVAWTIAFGVLLTGISADQGHRWAAGHRPYTQIRGE